MRDLTESNVTEAVLSTLEGTQDPRTREILSSLIRHLHAFAKDVRLSQEEWLAGIRYLFDAGEISTPLRNEFILTSDVLGLTSLVDILKNQGTETGTEHSVLGPFYIEGSPKRPFGYSMIGENEGEPTVVSGRVLSAATGEPIEGALVDLWQNAANGLYESEDPDQPEANLRCKLTSRADGAYKFVTVRPAPYTVPEDGPVGRMLRAVGRHPWRPAHIHFKVSAEGYETLVTEVFPEDDPYIDEDAVFGVRSSLAVPYVKVASTDAAAEHGVVAPFNRVDFDFVLNPSH